jgi:pimeloyl-ACP methyl ester carboxylesterase
MERLAILGISFGGYFVTRATAHEPRIKAMVANSPIVNLHDYLVAFTGSDPADASDAENFRLEDLPAIPEDILSLQGKVVCENLMVRFGQPSFRDTFRYLRQFSVRETLSRITCPCLARIGRGEGGEPVKQCQEFCANVSGPVQSYTFTAFEGADSHCQVGNPSFAAAVTLDWLDEIFD